MARDLIFRTLSGTLALLFLFVLIYGDHSALSLRNYLTYWFMTGLFGVFSLYGTRTAEILFLSFWVGPPTPQQNVQDVEQSTSNEELDTKP